MKWLLFGSVRPLLTGREKDDQGQPPIILSFLAEFTLGLVLVACFGGYAEA